MATSSTVDPVDSLALPREIMLAEPQWLRVAEEIRQRIRDGRVVESEAIKGGYRLPRYPELMAEHHAGYGTLRTVLLVLEAEGWIIRRPGVEISTRADHPK